MNKRYYVFLWSGLILCALIFAVDFRAGLRSDTVTDDVLQDTYVHWLDDERWEEENWEVTLRDVILTYPSVTEMVEASELIVLVTATENSVKRQEYILTKVDVLRTYKGNYQEPSLFVYESANLSTLQDKEGFSYFTDTAYVLMEPGEKYLLFLNLCKQPDGYEYSEIEKASYLIANTSFGKYAVRSTEHNALIACPVPFETIKSHDLLSNSQNLLNKYQEWKEKILSLYPANDQKV